MDCLLCGRRAMMYCESDQASLCCDCDEKVHGANFLVAKHHRSLLCYACQSMTPWTASGPKLTPTVSVCEGCVHSHRRKSDRGTDQESQGCNEVDDDGSCEVSESEGESDEEEEDDDNECDRGDGENQVVPWSHASSPPPTSPPAASSSSEGFSSGVIAKKKLKRKRQTRDASDSDDEAQSGSSSHQGREMSDESSSRTSFRSAKHLRPTIKSDQLPTSKDLKKQRGTDIMNSIKRLQTTMGTDCKASRKTILGMSNVSRDENH